MVNNKNNITPQLIAIHITSTIKNTLVTMTKLGPDNKVFFQISSRGYPIKMRKKNNAYILQKMSMQIIAQVKKLKKARAHIFIKGVGQGRYNVVKYLSSKNLSKKLKIISINDRTPIPFNGCRPKKQKRR